ncbi:hypothetical protein JTB14_025521 [Gonioctena quinquepunctata]|nr:hypothetical protein JTB14_025521 [Gonioctena quinquepunctata]
MEMANVPVDIMWEMTMEVVVDERKKLPIHENKERTIHNNDWEVSDMHYFTERWRRITCHLKYGMAKEPVNELANGQLLR